MIGNNFEVVIGTRYHRPGIYNFTASATDIFGQMSHVDFIFSLIGI